MSEPLQRGLEESVFDELCFESLAEGIEPVVPLVVCAEGGLGDGVAAVGDAGSEVLVEQAVEVVGPPDIGVGEGGGEVVRLHRVSVRRPPDVRPQRPLYDAELTKIVRDAWADLPGERRGYYAHAVLVLNAARVVAWRKGSRRPGVAIVYDHELIQRTGLPRSTFYETKKRIRLAIELGLLPFEVVAQERPHRGDAQLTEWHLFPPARPQSGQASPDTGSPLRNKNPQGAKLKERASLPEVEARPPPGSSEPPGGDARMRDDESEPGGERQPAPEVAELVVELERQAELELDRYGGDRGRAVDAAARRLVADGRSPFAARLARQLLDRGRRSSDPEDGDRAGSGIQPAAPPSHHETKGDCGAQPDAPEEAA